MAEVTFASLHEKMNFLLKDHGVENFDESDLDLESVSSLHAKANALCAAHGGDPSRMANDTLAQLHPKLDFLNTGDIQGAIRNGYSRLSQCGGVVPREPSCGPGRHYHLGHLKETRDAYQRRVDDDLALFPSLAAPDPHGRHPIREWLSTHTGPLVDAGCTAKPSAY